MVELRFIHTKHLLRFPTQLYRLINLHRLPIVALSLRVRCFSELLQQRREEICKIIYKVQKVFWDGAAMKASSENEIAKL